MVKTFNGKVYDTLSGGLLGRTKRDSHRYVLGRGCSFWANVILLVL
jgi:hypothetical protein